MEQRVFPRKKYSFRTEKKPPHPTTRSIRCVENAWSLRILYDGAYVSRFLRGASIDLDTAVVLPPFLCLRNRSISEITWCVLGLFVIRVLQHRLLVFTEALRSIADTHKTKSNKNSYVKQDWLNFIVPLVYIRIPKK